MATRIAANRICPGTTIEWDGQRIDVRGVEPDVEPGFIWVTNSPTMTPRNARICANEMVSLATV